jgi:hypothetical protein
MSSFAKTKCPNCGAITSYHLGGLGFYTNETTFCSCGCKYKNVENCIENILDRDDPPKPRLQSSLTNFSTEELEEELKRRRR